LFASAGYFDARLVRMEGFKPLFEHFEGVSDDKKAALQVSVALFDAPPRLLLGAG
jgi:hypothetical protein